MDENGGDGGGNSERERKAADVDVGADGRVCGLFGGGGRRGRRGWGLGEEQQSRALLASYRWPVFFLELSRQWKQWGPVHALVPASVSGTRLAS